jgi:hypothetical protein
MGKPMISKTFVVGTAAFALLMGAPLAAQADITLSNGPADGVEGGLGGQFGFTNFGEVFTAPITGTLSSFTLSLDGPLGNSTLSSPIGAVPRPSS